MGKFQKVLITMVTIFEDQPLMSQNLLQLYNRFYMNDKMKCFYTFLYSY